MLTAFLPHHAFAFAVHHGFVTFLALGAVTLAVTGAEALYADMGHFGRKPIRRAWLWLVLPALLANYYGQGALLLRDPSALENPFFRLAPDWALYPLVALATAATVIASQATISGAFSMAQQAALLGLSPRVRVQHTSASEFGQIYVPAVNWLLLAGVVALVLSFKSSTNLAAAYGIAVTGTMLMTTILVLRAGGARLEVELGAGGRRCSPPSCWSTLTLFSANMLKFLDGGWVPLAIAAVIFTAMWTWLQGRLAVAAARERRHAADRLPARQHRARAASIARRARRSISRRSRATRPTACCTISSTTRCCTSTSCC